MGKQTLPTTSFIEYDHHLAISFSSQTFLKIYQLHSMFCAERPLVRQALKDAKSGYTGKRNGRTIPLEEVRNQLFLTTASSLLLEVAIYMRVLDDHFGGMYPISDELTTCGHIRANDSEPMKPLTFREACNKIIHAKEHHFERTELGDSAKYRISRVPLFYYEPLVRYNGERNGHSWQAYLQVMPFCGLAARVCGATLIEGRPQ